MPTSVGPNTFGEENLVFGYDTGDTVNSYKGEPTVNVIADPLYALGTKNAYYDVNNTGWGTVTRGRIEEVIGPFGKPVQAYSQELISYTSGNRSMEGQPQDVVNNANCLVNLTSGVTYRISVWIKATYTGTSQNRLYLSGTAFTGDSDNRQVTTEWQRISRTYTPSTSGAYYMRHYDYSGGKEVGAKIWYAHPQVEVDKGHDTQFTTGTRSATQGLIDLTGNSTIDLTNVSFDSNAQIEFDGTDDQITHDRLQFLSSSSWTMSQVQSIDADAITSWQAFSGENRYVVGTSTNYGGFFMWHTNGVFWWYQSFDNPTTYGITQLSLSGGNIFDRMVGNGYFTVDVTYNGGTNTMKVYINGIEEGSATPTWAPGLDRISFVKVGGSSSRRFNGKIPTQKLYSRTLTASEIKANYNAIKGRFNI